MITIQQYRLLLHEIAELRRQQNDRDGVVHKVWSKNGEQKVQVQIGWKPSTNGAKPEPVLTGFCGTDDMRGPMRTEMKYTKGQPVRVSAVGGNYRNARVSPSQESQKHQRPQHATDYHATSQYDRVRHRYGPDFEEHWIAKKAEDDQQQQEEEDSPEATAESSEQAEIKPEKKDDVSSATALFRIGKKPQDQKDKEEPWDGPPMKGDASGKANEPKAIATLWTGKRSSGGSTPTAGEDSTPPDVQTESVHIQHGNKARSVLTDGNVMHSVGDLDDKGELKDAAQAAVHSILGESISTKVGDQSFAKVMRDGIQHITQNHVIKASGTNFLHGATTHLHGKILTHPQQLHGEDDPTIVAALHRALANGDHDEIHEAVYKFAAKYAAQDFVGTGNWMTATAFGSSPPQSINGEPFNGERWLDTTSGIEYSYFNGVWSEGGGDISFPAMPTVNDQFSYGGRHWTWNGVGWATTLHARADSLEGRASALEGSTATLSSQVTALRTRMVAYVIDGGNAVITTGMKGYMEVPFGCQIKKVTMLADAVGSIVVNIWKCSDAAFDAGVTHPVAGDAITASALPTITSAVKSQDAVLTGWNKTIATGDVLAFNVNSCSVIKRVTVALEVQIDLP